MKTTVEKKTRSNHLRLNKALDVLQPPQVLLLLLHVYVIRYEQSQRSVDTPLIQISFQKHLKILIKVAEWWSNIQVLSLVDLLCSLAVCMRCIGVVENVVNDDHSFLDNSFDCESSLSCLLDNDVQSCWERLLLLLFALAFLLLNLVFWCHLEILLVPLVDIILLVANSAILIVCFGVYRVQVGNGEGDFDTVIYQKLK